MMIGTVMMSQSSNQSNSTNTNGTETANMKQQQINSISQMIANGQEYISDTDMSERGGVPRSNRNQYSRNNNNNNNNSNKNGQYILNGTNLSYDQQSISSQSTTKMIQNRLNNPSATMMSNSNQMRQNSKNNYSGNNVSSATLASRKMSERSVNFDEENYSKLKPSQNEPNPSKPKTKQQQQQQQRGDSNHYGGTSNHYGPDQDEYETNPSNNKQQIQVQILPQDDNWGENTTAFTADFSDFNDDMTEDGRSSHFNGRMGSARKDTNVFIDIDEKQLGYGAGNCGSFRTISTYCSIYFGFLCAFCVSFCAFITPILFIILPRLNINQQWQVTECGIECEGLLIGIAFKMFVLLLGAWALFLRRPRASMPRIYELRAFLIFLLCIMTFSYWLFYAVRIIDAHAQDYHKILQFAVSYVDVLLFIFIVSVFILELRQVQPEYVVKIVRSPDGEQSEYLIGKMSIQRAAIWLLEQYYKDFTAYNPWLENAHRKRGAQLLQLEQQAASVLNKKSKLFSIRLIDIFLNTWW
jgi:vang-like